MHSGGVRLPSSMKNGGSAVSTKTFHVGLFNSFGPLAWQADEDRTYGGDWWTGDAHIDLARRLEAAAFDFLFFEDTLTVSRAVGGTMDADLKGLAYAPKHDPLPLLAVLAKATKHIGLMATASTTFTPPWSMARTFATLDGISDGRIGWNIVTTAEETSAENFGIELPEHDARYEMADEYLDVVKQLWDAWDADALVRDVAANVHVDPSKVREINHEGAYYKVRGPLNTLRSPQGYPVLIQAGSSDRGRAFAAKHAELVFAPMEGGLEGMKDLRDDLRARAASFGRSPDSIQVLWAAFLDFTDEAGAAPEMSDEAFERALTFWSTTLDHDLSQYPLDQPFPASIVNSGHTGFFDELQELGKQGVSLRDGIIAMNDRKGEGQVDLSGSPETIAEKMIAIDEAVGGDGYLIMSSYLCNPAFITNVVDRLAPALQSHGAMQRSYGPGTLRERLQATTPIAQG